MSSLYYVGQDKYFFLIRKNNSLILFGFTLAQPAKVLIMLYYIIGRKERNSFSLS